MSISEAQRRKDPHAGPGESYPLDPQHLKDAWDLAGHASDPDAVRRKVLAYARAHGLMGHLPQSAHEFAAGDTRLVRKAKGEDVAQLLDLAFNHENMEGDTYEKRRLIEWAQAHGLSQHLPDEAHGFMHQHNMPHTHAEDDHPMHTHTVRKAFNPVAMEWTVEKAWASEETPDLTHFEGWVSRNTGKPDLQREIVEPEAFQDAMESYFARRAPLSYTHGTTTLPAGHLQHAAILRDGQVVKSVAHPTDPADFEHLPQGGTGVYVRGVITDPTVGRSVRLGDTGGMSYIANLKEYEPLPGGGRRHLRYDPWIESTVAPYPINPEAVITVAKAFGLEDTEPMSQKQTPSLEEIMGRIDASLQEQNTEERVTKADLAALIEAFQESNQKLVETLGEKVEKALVPARGEGTGRVGGEPAVDPREADPLGYIVKKAAQVASEDTELSPEDKDLAYQLFVASMFTPVRAFGGADSDE